MFNRVLVRSGQFILRPKNIELNVDSFRILVEDACAEYSRTRPYDKTYNISFKGNLHRTWDANFDTELKRIPDWISEVTPTNLTNMYGSPYDSGRIITDSIESPWVWENNVLTVPYYSNYKVVACYEHIVEETPVENDTPFWEVRTITTKDTLFFKLLQAMFLQGIGRSRRAFTHNDLPITMDADTLASEAETMLNDIKEELGNVQKWYLAIG